MERIQVGTDTFLAAQVKGKGVPIIFLNGFGAYQQVWTAQSDRFSRQYQTITYDYRGQGQSTGIVAKSLKELANDLKTLLNKLKVKEPVVVAHSMGASVAWTLRKYFPEIKVRGMVIVDQSPKMLNTDDWEYGFTGLNRQNIKEHLSHRSALHESLNGLVPEVMRPLIKAELEHPFIRSDGRELLLEHITMDWREVVLEEKNPVLYVNALQSPYFKTGYGEWLKLRSSMVQVANIIDTGHVIMAEVPCAFNQTLQHFLKQLKLPKI